MENIGFIEENRTRRIEDVALELSKRHDLDAPFILRQIEGWQRLRHKVPAWALTPGLHYPPRLALEQCSGEAAARYKAALVRRLLGTDAITMTDLTGGLGIDFSFIAPLFKEAVYVERQAALVEAARHNMPLLGIKNARFIEADAAEHLSSCPRNDLFFLDPARRNGAGRKTVMIEDCTPNVAELCPLLTAKSAYTLVKLSPMLDLHHAISTLKCVAEAHVFAAGGECKELLLVLRADAPGIDPPIHCADDGQELAFSMADERAENARFAAEIQSYLYEPGPAVLKAGAYNTTATRYGLRKLHPNSHLYTSQEHLSHFPGRCFRVEQVVGFSKKELRALTSQADRANISVRNFPATVAELRLRLRLKEGGDRYIFATTLANGRKVLLVCGKA